MKKEMNVAIGSRVREAREALGFSRAEFSELLGISQLFLGYIETGERGMSVETMQSICKTLHVSADYLLFGVTAEPKPKNEIDKILFGVSSDYYPLLKEQLKLSLKTISASRAESSKKSLSTKG